MLACPLRGRYQGAKWTLRKLYSTSVSHNHAPSQLPYPPADSLPRSGLVQYMFCDPDFMIEIEAIAAA
jgi:hypothetical protein